MTVPAMEVASGMWAGVVGTVLGYPLDLVKGRIQINPGAYASFGQALVRIARHDGVVGLYRGVGAPIVMMMGVNGERRST